MHCKSVILVLQELPIQIGLADGQSHDSWVQIKEEAAVPVLYVQHVPHLFFHAYSQDLQIRSDG